MFADGDFGWFEGLRRLHYPPERNRVQAHLTLFSHLPPSIEGELDTRLAGYAALPPPRARIAGVMDLGGGTAFRIESAMLEDIRRDLAGAFHGLLVPQDRVPWTPHVTIQNKVEAREARTLQAKLAATFQPRALTIKGLGLWRYLDGPWQPLKRHMFRG